MTTRGDAPANLVIALLFEAQKKFGRITESNQAQVSRWIQRRVREITRERDPVDGKARAVGDE